jgi:polysaccharide biosynthesis protein PslA
LSVVSIRIEGARVVEVQHPRVIFGRLGFALAAVAGEALLIIALALLTGILYHLAVYGVPGPLQHHAEIGVLTALLFSVPTLLREEETGPGLAVGSRTPSRIFLLWNYTFVCLLFLGLLTKTTAVYSRAWLIVFYVAGLASLIGFERLVARVHGLLIAMGRVASRRVMLVGPSEVLLRVLRDETLGRAGYRVVATATPTGTTTAAAAEALGLAVEKARRLEVEDVLILTDWSTGDTTARVVDAFTELPVAVHLMTSDVIGQFARPRITRFGATHAISLTAPPMSGLQAVAKRTFDVVVGSAALIVLSPLLALLGLLIKLDSPGPVFFRQRRRGYNLREFRIWKLRTMTTLDDGPVIRQATVGDARVTRVGRWLRRYNLDELPQLINVVMDEMSLVGPRPHAMAHDLAFEKNIARYGRRLNVLPGITGWAQVNGLRGVIEDEDALRRRVEYDLYYVDHRSIAFDLSILALTVVSPKAYRNAA